MHLPIDMGIVFFEQNNNNVFEQTKLVVNDGVVQKKDLLNDSVKKERN